MLSMLAMAASRCTPSASAEGSLKLPSSVLAGPPDGALGVGVDGGLGAGFDAGAGAGALGGAGVCATLGTGVEGGLADEEAEEDPAGAALGFTSYKPRSPRRSSCSTYLGDHANDETLLLDAVGLHRVCIL